MRFLAAVLRLQVITIELEQLNKVNCDEPVDNERRHLINDVVALKLGTHYPSLRAVFTGRDHGCPTRVSFWTSVFIGPVGNPYYDSVQVGNDNDVVINNNPCSRVSKITPVSTGRVGKRRCREMLSANTARVHGMLGIHATV